MKKSIWLVVLMMAAGVSAGAQNSSTVSGKVIDTDSEPIGWATVAIMNADSSIVSGTACNDKGEYQLSLTAGKHILMASMMGYQDKYTEIELTPGLNTIEDIVLEADEQQLAAARITEREKLIDVKIDKIIMNVAQSAFAQGSNGLDLIKKAPGVTIDKDGNIKLNGKSVEVWIDGRPSHMSGKSLESLLRSTNGESIDKFELMEHPSAKYDAAGQGGIINIKTKKNFLKGLNGSLGIGGGGMYYKSLDYMPGQQTAWANLAYRTDKTNTFLNINEGYYNSPVNFTNSLIGKDIIQKSHSIINGTYTNYNIKFGNDWFVNAKNTLGFILMMPGDIQSMSFPSTGNLKENGVITQKTVSEITNNNRSAQYSANLNYTHIFDEQKAAEITANLDYYKNIGQERNTQHDTTTIQDIPVIKDKYINADIKYDIWSAKLDYQSVVWNRFMLEAGAKWALSLTDNKSSEIESFVPDLNTVFTYQEHIGAAYASLAGQLNAKWSFKAGLRGEYTNSLGNWISANDKTKRSYFNLFPTVFVGYNPNANWHYALSYSRRINRPGYTQLNPTKTFIDSKTYIKGNPDILPQYSNDITLSSGYGQHLSFALGSSYCNNEINQSPSYKDGITYLTWDNLGTSLATYLTASLAAYPLTKWLQWTASTSGMYLRTTIKNSETIKNCTSIQGYTCLSFTLPKDWKIDLDAFGNSGMTVGPYIIKGFVMSNIAAKKTMLDGKLILTLKVDDIFRSMKTDLETTDEFKTGFTTQIQQSMMNQRFIVDLTWNFGTQHHTKQRKVGNMDEMSRTGRSSLGGK